jgi:hypothetical protein
MVKFELKDHDLVGYALGIFVVFITNLNGFWDFGILGF